MGTEKGIAPLHAQVETRLNLTKPDVRTKTPTLSALPHDRRLRRTVDETRMSSLRGASGGSEFLGTERN